MKLPEKRSVAKALGIKRFFTGLPCAHGHISERLTSSGNCLTCSASAKAASARKNKDAVNASHRAYRAKNADVFRSREREKRMAEPERFAANAARWRERRPWVRAAQSAKRRAAIVQRTPLWADLEKIAAVYERAALLTKETGVQHDVDHIIPLRGICVSGLHVAENLQVIVFVKNRSKGNRFDAVVDGCDMRVEAFKP